MNVCSHILAAIKEKAIKIAADYPNITDCDWREQLWAISSSYEGTCMANDDCHKFIELLRQKLNMSKEELIELWKINREN